MWPWSGISWVTVRGDGGAVINIYGAGHITITEKFWNSYVACYVVHRNSMVAVVDCYGLTSEMIWFDSLREVFLAVNKKYHLMMCGDLLIGLNGQCTVAGTTFRSTRSSRMTHRIIGCIVRWNLWRNDNRWRAIFPGTFTQRASITSRFTQCASVSTYSLRRCWRLCCWRRRTDHRNCIDRLNGTLNGAKKFFFVDWLEHS